MPVVPCPHRGERQIAVRSHLLQPLAGETWQKRRKVQRCVDAVEVHVLDALVNVPGAPAHLVEAHRLEAVLRDRAPDDGVEADVRQHLVVIDPGLAAIGGVDDFGRPISQPLRQTTGEGVRRFDDVVVDGDQGVAASCPRRIGKKCDRSVVAGLGGGEAQVRGQFVDRFHSQSAQLSTAGSALMVRRAAPAQYTSAARSISERCMPAMSDQFICAGCLPVSMTS